MGKGQVLGVLTDSESSAYDEIAEKGQGVWARYSSRSISPKASGRSECEINEIASCGHA
jgi:hypothetical protein